MVFNELENKQNFEYELCSMSNKDKLWLTNKREIMI